MVNSVSVCVKRACGLDFLVFTKFFRSGALHSVFQYEIYYRCAQLFSTAQFPLNCSHFFTFPFAHIPKILLKVFAERTSYKFWATGWHTKVYCAILLIYWKVNDLYSTFYGAIINICIWEELRIILNCFFFSLNLLLRLTFPLMTLWSSFVFDLGAQIHHLPSQLSLSILHPLCSSFGFLLPAFSLSHGPLWSRSLTRLSKHT